MKIPARPNQTHESTVLQPRDCSGSVLAFILRSISRPHTIPHRSCVSRVLGGHLRYPPKAFGLLLLFPVATT